MGQGWSLWWPLSKMRGGQRIFHGGDAAHVIDIGHCSQVEGQSSDKPHATWFLLALEYLFWDGHRSAVVKMPIECPHSIEEWLGFSHHSNSQPMSYKWIHGRQQMMTQIRGSLLLHLRHGWSFWMIPSSTLAQFWLVIQVIQGEETNRQPFPEGYKRLSWL